MKIKPLFDRVLIKPDEKESVTKSGIVLPQTAQERPQTGRVIAVGSGIDLDNNNVGMQVSVGDTIIYNKYTGAEVKVDDETLLLLRQIDIIGIVEK